MSEYQEQAALFAWAALQEGVYPELALMFATLNGAQLAGGGRAWAILQRAGAKKGLPDIILPVARGGWHGLAVELKVGENRPSQSQVEWLDRLTEQGYLATACWGWEDAKETIVEYLGGSHG